jgi:hypothetical protein
MAQLPFLIYEQRPPMSSAAFKALAESLMDGDDAELLNHIYLDPDAAGENPPSAEGVSTGCNFIDNWKSWEHTLRLNLEKNRAIKLKRDSLSMAEPPFYPADAAAAAHRAVNSDGSPLDTEILLDKARWNAIEGLAGNDYFDRNNVYAYLLKLMLIERRLLFNVEKGFAEYKSLYASIIESAQNAGEHK